MRTEVMMSSELLAGEASPWLRGVGHVVQPSADARVGLVVHHDDAAARDVRRMVEIVDPAAAQVR
jgi:hypothetical protein